MATTVTSAATAAATTTSQRSTFRRLGDRIIRIVIPSVEEPLERREYTRAEIRTFQAQLAATGVDLGSSRYPSPRSVAFRGPEDFIADRPWRNGMFLDLPRTPIAWEERAQHQHQQYQRQQRQHAAAAAAAAANQSAYERRQHAYERRLRLPPVRHATPPQPLSQLQRLQQLQRQRQQQAQQQQRQRLMVQQEWEDDQEARAMAMVIANVNWDDDRLFERALSVTTTNSDAGCAIRIGPAPGTADWDNDTSYQRARRTTSIAESEQQQQQPGRGPATPATPPNLCYLSTPASESDSDDSDTEYVNSEGMPFPKMDKEGLSAEDAEYASSASRPFPKVPMGELSNQREHLVRMQQRKRIVVTNPDPIH